MTKEQTSAGQWIIETRNLTRRFGKVMAVNGLNLAVPKGEIFGLVGPDAAGKTTTIRLLAGVLRPTAGTATVAGYDVVQDIEVIKPRMGYMAQQFSLYRDLTVLENIDFFATVYRLHGLERQARIERLLRFARLTEFTGRRAAHLSGGMQKKLALACVLIHQPEIIFLDEPTTGVDPVSRREFWDILTELHLEGVTVFVSTPYMDEADRCSLVGLMHRGQLVACDSPERLQRLIAGELVELRPLAEEQGVGLIRRAEALVAALPGVLEVQTFGDLLRVFVDDAAQRGPQVKEALAAQSIQAEGLRRTHPRMEDAFISLVRLQQDGQREK